MSAATNAREPRRGGTHKPGVKPLVLCALAIDLVTTRGLRPGAAPLAAPTGANKTARLEAVRSCGVREPNIKLPPTAPVTG